MNRTRRLTLIAFAAALLPTPLAALYADEAVTLPDATQADARLHADGKGWRLDMAKVTDPTRPRVLLVGDSILNGYLKPVTASLNGKAYVDAWVNPYAQSPHLNKLLAEVLGLLGGDGGGNDRVRFRDPFLGATADQRARVGHFDRRTPFGSSRQLRLATGGDRRSRRCVHGFLALGCPAVRYLRNSSISSGR